MLAPGRCSNRVRYSIKYKLTPTTECSMGAPGEENLEAKGFSGTDPGQSIRSKAVDSKPSPSPRSRSNSHPRYVHVPSGPRPFHYTFDRWHDPTQRKHNDCSWSPSALNLHTMIWHAGPSVKPFMTEASQVIDLSAIYRIPGDFNGIKRAAYWTLQKDKADRYAL